MVSSFRECVDSNPQVLEPAGRARYCLVRREANANALAIPQQALHMNWTDRAAMAIARQCSAIGAPAGD
jgi:hypothetical protein